MSKLEFGFGLLYQKLLILTYFVQYYFKHDFHNFIRIHISNIYYNPKYKAFLKRIELLMLLDYMDISHYNQFI